jgi:hypothetical protein
MATRQHGSDARRGRSRPSGASGRRQEGRKAHSPDHVYGVRVPARLREAIESERDNLAKVESILACLVISMECGTDPLKGPYYPSVAQTARELLDRSINALDPFVLKQRLLNKIEEGLGVSFDDQPYALLPQASSRPALIGAC